MAKEQPTVLQKAVSAFINNEATLRREAIQRLLNIGKDINFECGYPDSISVQDYRGMYDREGYAKRVVHILPEETWSEPPDIYETEDPDETDFEKEWTVLQEKYQVFQYLQRADVLSGIGQFGILLFGLDDGKSLAEPVEGFNEITGEVTGTQKRQLIFIRAFDENVVKVKSKESSFESPRYGQPKIYEVTFENPTGAGSTQRSSQVHWTRILHIADNRDTSEVYGTPRMKPVYNRLLDLRKILSGSAEMFWKGGFPGYTAEIDPNVAPAVVENNELLSTIQTALKDQVEDYFNSLQRVLAVAGMSFKSLQPQISDPRESVETHLRIIALSLGIPYRIFIGTEEAKLASSQDVKTFDKRIGNRQNQYATPMIIRPAIDRLIAYGVISEPKEYFVNWPERGALTEQEEAEIAVKRTEAMAKYVAGSVSSELMAPVHFLTNILGLSQEEADAILKEVKLLEPEPIEEAPVPLDNDLIPNE